MKVLYVFHHASLGEEEVVESLKVDGDRGRWDEESKRGCKRRRSGRGWFHDHGVESKTGVRRG